MKTSAGMSLGCSAFCLSAQSNFLVGRNLDVPFLDGYILTNRRGLNKRSLVEAALDPAIWTSRWGSITFNLLGPNLPMGGMNECGLVVEHLWMPGTAYPDRKGRRTLLEFEWIQFLLDGCSTVAEVLSRSEEFVVARDRVEMHFLIADAAGASALLEFENGELRVCSGATFPIPAVTNSWYRESLDYLSRLRGPGGTLQQIPDSLSSLDRFARLASHLVGDTDVTSCLNGDSPVPRRVGDSHVSGDVSGEASASAITAFAMLQSVLDSTLLSVVYDPAGGRILYRSRSNPARRELRLSSLDCATTAVPLMLDIHLETECISPFDPAAMSHCAATTIASASEFLKLDAYLPAIVGAA